MKKALLLTFSGTGNTKLCGDFLSSSLKEEGYEVTHYVYKAPNKDVPNPNDYDVLGLGYPIHAFNVPEAFNSFLKKLPKVNNKHLFIYKVSGEPYHLNDASSYHFYKKLKKKGYILHQEKHFIMPYNIMFRYKDEVEKQMYLYLEPLTKVFAKMIANDEQVLIKYKFRYKVLSFFLRIEWVAPKLNCFFAGCNKKKCIHCNKCVTSCPTQSMYFKENGKLKIRHTCAMCMKCTLECPKDAIRFGFMNPWKVNGLFNFDKLVKDDSLDPSYINANTSDYFKHFRKYMKEQNILLEKYGIPIPVKYTKENDLSNYKK